MIGNKPTDPKKNHDFYQQNFLEYHHRTFPVDPSSFLEPLLKHLDADSNILDVGCGSGRDLLWFKNQGFNVKGFERSAGLAGLARQNAGCEVIEGDFESFDFSHFQVDAVILVGTLVHVPHKKLAGVLARIIKSLRPTGYALITLKEGKDARNFSDGRTFYLWEDPILKELFNYCGLSLIDYTRQISKIRKNDIWLGYVLQKTP